MFFLVLGGGIFLLFVASDLANNPDFDYFFMALVLMFIGWRMWSRKPPPPPAGRFERWNKWRAAQREKKANKTKGKQEAKK